MVMGVDVLGDGKEKRDSGGDWDCLVGDGGE